MNIYYESELCHHGIKGQKWGVRRYQNPDGSYTKAGILRNASNRDLRKIDKKIHTRRGKYEAVGKLTEHALLTAEGSKLYKNRIEEAIREVSKMKLSDYSNDPRWEYPGDANDKKEIASYKKDTVSRLTRARDEMTRLETGWNKVFDMVGDIKIDEVNTGTDLIDMIDRAFTDPKKPKKG